MMVESDRNDSIPVSVLGRMPSEMGDCSSELDQALRATAAVG